MRSLFSAAAWLALAAVLGAAPRHPSVYMTPEDVARARENIRRFPWARATADAIVRTADGWLGRDDAWLRGVVPPAGAAFAYGSTGCPICASGWGTWGGAHASFDDPGHVVCARGHRLPDREHPDPGTGYVGPGRRIHYFVGSYNAWVVETLTFKAVDSLAYAYTLTSDERYAAKAAVILDALAAVYPQCDKGSWDYPSNPPSGRFNRPWYQVARVLVHYVDFYDQIRGSAALDTPSVAPGLTRRRNIEEHLLRNGAEYCYRESLKGGLHNGEADYIRGGLAVGALLDIPRYIQWAVDGPYGIYSLIENNIDRDGGYFETSSLYANHTRGLYFSFAEPLLNYRGTAYPRGLDLYRHPKLRLFFALHNLAQNAAGHMPRYGDSGPDTAKIAAPARPFDRDDYDYLERLYARTTSPARERELAAAIRWLAGGRLEALRGSDHANPDAMGGGFAESRWMLFHATELPPVAAALPPDLERRLLASDFLGQKGIALLRSGDQALVLRFGPSLNHGHLDDLNINWFARGYELTYDLGYGNGATHTQVGWAKQTAAHNLVVVDETSQLQNSGSGGSLHLFADLPGLKLAEASSEESHRARGVSLYRRTVALVGEGADSYLVDIFRVRGGSRHDYGFHALGDDATLTGVTLGAREAGSLAGPEVAWGERQLNDGYLSGVAQTPYWVAPPGNGFGFLVRPRRGTPAGSWSADWRIDAATRLRLHLPAGEAAEAVTAVAPGIYPAQPRARYVFARRRGAAPLESRFVAVAEAYEGTPRIRTVERLPVEGPAGEVPQVAVRVERTDGTVDYLFSSGDDVPRRAAGATFAGRFIHVRLRDNKPVAAEVAGTREFHGYGLDIRTPRDAWRGTVAAVDYETNVLTTSAPLPAGSSLEGAVIYLSNPRYSRNSAYRIERVEEVGGRRRIRLAQTIVLGRGQVGKVVDARSLTTVIPHEYARTVQRGESGFFQGKRIATAAGASTLITGTHYSEGLLRVENTAGFRPGEVFRYYDVQAGDTFTVPETVVVRH